MPRAKSPALRTQYFTACLQTLMEANELNQVTLSQNTGIAISRINNYLHGKYRTIRPDHLSLIARAAGSTAAQRADLIKTYLIDLLPEDLLADVQIQPTASKGKAAQAGAIPLPPQGAKAIGQLIDLSSRNAQARARIAAFAEIMTEAHPK
jgi:transcriptional regulator with XRE-family HTH domain